MISRIKNQAKVINTQVSSAATAVIRIDRDMMNLDGINSDVSFPDSSNKQLVKVVVKPKVGVWKSGTFEFLLKFPDAYPHEPPVAKYTGPTRIWHPNIEGDDGANAGLWGVCLNILRGDYKPVLGIRDFVFGLEMMFFEPNIDDPLPGTAKQAAQQLKDDPKGFERKAQQWMRADYR